MAFSYKVIVVHFLTTDALVDHSVQNERCLLQLCTRALSVITWNVKRKWSDVQDN